MVVEKRRPVYCYKLGKLEGVVCQTVFYSFETWIQNDMESRRVEGFGMKGLKRDLGENFFDRIRSSVILGQKHSKMVWAH